ncbi:hypothetical protein FAIPA1_10086 [Frankia sp. AiPs1]
MEVIRFGLEAGTRGGSDADTPRTEGYRGEAPIGGHTQSAERPRRFTSSTPPSASFGLDRLARHAGHPGRRHRLEPRPRGW